MAQKPWLSNVDLFHAIYVASAAVSSFTFLEAVSWHRSGMMACIQTVTAALHTGFFKLLDPPRRRDGGIMTINSTMIFMQESKPKGKDLFDPVPDPTY